MSGDEGWARAVRSRVPTGPPLHNTLARVCVCSTHTGSATYDGFSACVRNS